MLRITTQFLSLALFLPVLGIAQNTTSLTATAGNAQVKLDWTPPTAVSYTTFQVFRGIAPNIEMTVPLVQLGSVRTFTDTGVVNGVRYYYRVRGLRPFTPASNSNEVTALPAGAATAPPVTQRFEASAGAANITLSWVMIPGATSYNLYRGTTPNVSTATPFLSGLTALMHVDSQVTPGTTYFYKLAGVNAVGVGTPSSEVGATVNSAVQPPTAPQSLTANPANAQVILEWGNSANAKSYNVYRATTPNSPFLSMVASNVTITRYIDRAVTVGSTYYYRVAGVNASGIGPTSAMINTTVQAIPTIPTAPLNLTQTSGVAQVTLSWAAPTSANARTYNVFRALGSGITGGTPIATGLTTTSFVNTGLTNGTDYYYRVVAVNDLGSSPMSNEVKGTPQAAPAPPGAPTNLQGLSGDKQVTLSWNTPTTGVVATYNLYRGTAPGVTTAMPIATSITGNSFVNTQLTNDTTYYYRVAAVNANGLSALSNEVSVKPTGATVVPPTGTPTLLFAQLSGEGQAITSASGQATLQVAADARTAVLRFSFANLTTPVTGKHLHGPANPGEGGAIAYDIDTAEKQADGSYLWTITAIASASQQQIVEALRSGRIYINIHTSKYPGGEIRGHFRTITGGVGFTPPNPPPALPNTPPTLSEASRFLTQASWGPTLAEMDRVKQIGYNSWLEEQFTKPPVDYLKAVNDYVTVNTNDVSNTNSIQETFWPHFLKGEDQLRSRVAMALSQTLVISLANGDLGGDPRMSSAYINILNQEAFGNFRTLLKRVTLNPAMGIYLNMIRNQKENPATGRVPNENYAREILQLFSIGLWKLNPDGSLALGTDLQPIPSYDQDEIIQFARIFTGWSWGGEAKTNANFTRNRPLTALNVTVPMEAYPAFHSTGIKTLLDGYIVPDGLTPEQDLDLALDNIFNHPNVGPFICRQLIQRLVTSNPSPGYVYRVAQIFNNNGAGVRGDLRAVVKAILLDYEARSNNMLTNQGYGKQKEPIVRLAQLLRAFNANNATNRFQIFNLQSTNNLTQAPLRAPTVFNFFLPHYVQPGALAAAGLVAPEFQITTENQIIAATNYLSSIVTNSGMGSNATRINIEYTPQLALAGNTPAETTALLNHLNDLLLSGQMSDGLRAAITTSLNGMLSRTDAEKLARVRQAVRLIISSAEFTIQR
jgi:uncharacterized protein (DUF1800 family)/fibronectin type 3 domain-containing protein